jgi:hypothetical protein
MAVHVLNVRLPQALSRGCILFAVRPHFGLSVSRDYERLPERIAAMEFKRNLLLVALLLFAIHGRVGASSKAKVTSAKAKVANALPKSIISSVAGACLLCCSPAGAHEAVLNEENPVESVTISSVGTEVS